MRTIILLQILLLILCKLITAGFRSPATHQCGALMAKLFIMETLSVVKDILQKQLAEVEDFMIKEMTCGASVRKLEKWEKDFAKWKMSNGFHTADDCESIAATIRMRIDGETV